VLLVVLQIWKGVGEQGTQGAAATREYRFLLLGDHLALLASGRRRHVQVSVSIRVSIAFLRLMSPFEQPRRRLCAVVWVDCIFDLLEFYPKK
jgi:hypothetical protein